MAFPTIGAIIATDGTTTQTDMTINLPSGIKAGETLVIFIRKASVADIVFPNGWTELFDDASDASDDQTAMAWRKADGTEGSTVTVTSTANARYACLAMRVSGATDPLIRPPQFATLTTGTGTTPDPGTVTPTGGAKDYLFMWAGGWEGEQTSPPASNPSGYTDVNSSSSGSAGATTTNCRVAVAFKQANASSEDPGSWTISVSEDWTATVVAFHPAEPVTAGLDRTGGSSVRVAVPSPRTRSGILTSFVLGTALALSYVAPEVETIYYAGQETVIQSKGPAPYWRTPNLLTSTLAPSIPFRQSEWPNPARGFASLAVDMSARPSEVVDPPFKQSLWPNPRLPIRSALTWTDGRELFLQDIKPFDQSRWPNPQVAKRPLNVVDRPSLNTGTLAPAAAAAPFSCSDWPVPQRKVDPLFNRAFIQHCVFDESTPHKQDNWPNPQRRAATPRTTTLGITILRHVVPETLPFSQSVWPNPAVKKRLSVGTSTRPSGEGEEAPVGDPFFQHNWPNPLRKNLSLKVGISSRPNVEEEEEPPAGTPFNQTQWPVPARKVSHLTNRTFTGYYVYDYSIPHKQGNWPVPPQRKLASKALRTWIWYFVIDNSEPFVTQSTEVPRARLRNVAHLAQIPTRQLGAVEIQPFNQKLWPTAKSVSRPVPDFYTRRFPGLDVAQSVPFNQLDWANPTLSKKSALSWTYRNLSTLTVGSPFSQQIWTVPQSKVHQNVGLIVHCVFDESTPHHQNEWVNPAPQRRVRPSFTATRFQGLVDAVAADPFKAINWPNPVQKVKPTHEGSVGRFQGLDVVAPTPFSQTSWPNPLLQKSATLSWVNDNHLAPQTVGAPFSFTGWSNPVLPKATALTWTQRGDLVLAIETPFAQTAWPNPTLQKVSALTWSRRGDLVLTVGAPLLPIEWKNPLYKQPQTHVWVAKRDLFLEDIKPFEFAAWPTPPRKIFITHLLQVPSSFLALTVEGEPEDGRPIELEASATDYSNFKASGNDYDYEASS